MATWKLIYGGDMVGNEIPDDQKIAMVTAIDDILKTGEHGWLTARVDPADDPYLELLVTTGVSVGFAREAEPKTQLPRRIR